MSRRRGFTLVEVLVAMCLIVLVTGCVVAVLSGGFRVWERMQRQWELSACEYAFLSISRDLHNMQPFKPIPFKGEYDSMLFPGLVDARTEKGLDYKEVGRVGFFLDPQTSSICRSKHSYRGLSSADSRRAESVIAGGVQRLRFSYMKLDPVLGGVTWVDSWESQEAPNAVKVEVTYKLKSSGETVNRSAIIDIPGA